MKLSEAIRLGAMALPECHGPVIEWDLSDHVWSPCGACLLGSAWFALRGHEMTFATYYRGDALDNVTKAEEVLTAQWPWVTRDVPDPNGGAEAPVLRRAMILYEYSGWSRERVADWIESLEATVLEGRHTQVESAVAPTFELAASSQRAGSEEF